jgi:hypothetical protein
VRLERLAVALRPRGGWEALDLGFQMARQWWRPIWSAWFALYLPAAALAFAIFSEPFHSVLLLWWLKPLFDRAVLHVASRAVFGEPQGMRDTLRAARDWLRPGLAAALTFYRVDMARSFALPVWQLEKQRGTAGHRRRKALGSRMRGYAVWLTVVCINLEWITMIAIAGFAAMLEPTAGAPGPDESEPEDLELWEALTRWTAADFLYYLAAVSLIEPFYVTAGFALYLNRRAILEGWDIELALRRLEDRLRSAARAAALLLCTGVLAALAALQPLPALAKEKSAQDEIKAVLDSPEFSQHRDVSVWRYLGAQKKPKDPSARWVLFWTNLAQLFGDVTQGLLWVAVAVLVVLAAVYLRRFIPEPRMRERGYRPPNALFGLEVAPESLPDDVAGTAAALAQQGRLREALSLLYRGALSSLIHSHHLPLAAGHTEGDCLKAVRQALPRPVSEYFAGLVRTWQSAAYAARSPDADAVRALCEAWQPHFSPAASS